jgi:hypothetical protein
MTTDDPCDGLPALHERTLWALTMLDRVTDPAHRRAIKYAMNAQYGRAVRFVTSTNDAHDDWNPLTPHVAPWAVVLDA